MATNAKKEFDEKSAPSGMLDAKAYQALLEKLVAEGTGMGKTKSIGGFLLDDIHVVTETDKGGVETSRPVKVEEVYILMDRAWYQDETKLKLVMHKMLERWAERLTERHGLIPNDEMPDFRGVGVWVNKQSKVDDDYVHSKDPLNPHVLEPNPDAVRVGLVVTESVNLPVQWAGGFSIPEGGTLAVREKDLKAVAEALASIRRGDKTAEEALLTKDEKGKTIAIFDVYGMYADAAASYDPVLLKEETVAIQSKANGKPVVAFRPARPSVK